MAEVKIKTTDGNNAVTLAGPASGADVTLKLPTAAGSAGQYLKTDGSNGQLSFATVAVGGATGTDYNDSVKTRWGTDNDLEMYHDNSNSYIKHANNGSLEIDATSSGHIILKPDGEVQVGNSKNLKIDNGNLIVGTSGKGIDFSATANSSATGASMSSELFADYEEGSWTPTLAEGSATFTKCKYVRIGNMCYLNFHCDNVTDRTSSTDWLIAAASLPFMPDTDFTDNMIMGPVAHRYTSHADNATLHASVNGSGIGWYSSNDTEGDDAYSAFKHSHVDQTYSNFHFSGWYYV